MARDSRSKSTQNGRADSPRHKDLWQRGIARLIDHGKLMWLLGEGLNAAQAAQARGWSPADEQGFVTACYQWVQQSFAEIGQGTAHVGRGQVAAKGARSQQEATPRPDLDLRRHSLADLTCPVLWIGSRAVTQSWKSMAVGVGLDGFKRVLALVDGSVRERAVAEELLDDLQNRGFAHSRGVLVITEGSRTLDLSLQRKYPGARVSHCRTRVAQDVLAHVPEARRDQVLVELDAAWSMPWDTGLELLKDLETRLKDDAPGAAERLSRSIEASVTLNRLELSSPLKERLLTAGILGMAFKKCLKFSPSNSGSDALSLGVGPWLNRSRRLVGWRGLELLAHKLEIEAKTPINKAAPPTFDGKGAAER